MVTEQRPQTISQYRNSANSKQEQEDTKLVKFYMIAILILRSQRDSSKHTDYFHPYAVFLNTDAIFRRLDLHLFICYAEVLP